MTKKTLNGPHGDVSVFIHGDDATGIPLLVINGGPGAAHGYLESLATFSDERPVILYDQLGTGDSDHPNDTTLWTVANSAREIDFVRLELALDRVHLYSHSAGCAFAIQHLLDGGSAESHLMLSPMISTEQYNRDGAFHRANLPQEDQDILTRTESDPNFANWTYPVDLPEDYVEVTHRFAGLHWCRLNPPPQAAIDAFGQIDAQYYKTMYGPEFFYIRGTLKDAEQFDRLGEIATPTCIIAGEFDWITPANVDIIAAGLPNCERHQFDGCAHLSNLEKPTEHDAIAKAFFRRVESLA